MYGDGDPLKKRGSMEVEARNFGIWKHIYWLVATQIFFMFTCLFGEASHFDSYCSKGLKPPTSLSFLASITIAGGGCSKSFKGFARGIV